MLSPFWLAGGFIVFKLSIAIKKEMANGLSWQEALKVVFKSSKKPYNIPASDPNHNSVFIHNTKLAEPFSTNPTYIGVNGSVYNSPAINNYHKAPDYIHDPAYSGYSQNICHRNN